MLTLTDLTPRSHSGTSSILCKIVWLKSLGGGAERNAVSRFQNFNSLWRCWGYVISPPISFQRYEAMSGGLALKRHRQPKHDLRRFSQMGCLLAKRCGNKQHKVLCYCRAVAFVWLNSNCCFLFVIFTVNAPGVSARKALKANSTSRSPLTQNVMFSVVLPQPQTSRETNLRLGVLTHSSTVTSSWWVPCCSLYYVALTS